MSDESRFGDMAAVLGESPELLRDRVAELEAELEAADLTPNIDLVLNDVCKFGRLLSDLTDDTARRMREEAAGDAMQGERWDGQ